MPRGGPRVTGRARRERTTPSVRTTDERPAPSTLSSVSRATPICALVLLLAACAGPEEDDVALDEETAQALSQGAQRLAAALEDEDPCAAMAEADAVNAQARDGVASGTVPADVANQVEAVTTELTSDLTCDPDEEDAEQDAEDTDAEQDGEDTDAEQDGEDTDAEQEPDEGGEPEDRGNGGPPDDRGNGPDGEGPPGQAQGGGAGPGGQGGGR